MQHLSVLANLIYDNGLCILQGGPFGSESQKLWCQQLNMNSLKVNASVCECVRVVLFGMFC